ncbi:MAG TPA: imidazole glycerol phosphate synthase subunit HisH [Gammaproteobacteria bacterium]|nr:imidazole glycerol phosphate synthase subunit HisH [Gammaproteobacteria bacterium]
MSDLQQPTVAIVDYGMGNLFSVKHACEAVGLPAVITSSKREILAAEAVILPGVGAFGDAMDALRRLDLVTVLQDIAVSEKLFVGICLGMQLLMSESREFGVHKGLGIIEGAVLPFDSPLRENRKLKVPQVTWNRIYKVKTEGLHHGSWVHTPLEGLPDGEFMYFVHSYYAVPLDDSVLLSTTRYGHIEFASSLRYRNIFACQFHPERSGPQGLQIYRNLVSFIQDRSVPKEE